MGCLVQVSPVALSQLTKHLYDWENVIVAKLQLAQGPLLSGKLSRCAPCAAKFLR